MELSPCMCSYSSCPGWRNDCHMWYLAISDGTWLPISCPIKTESSPLKHTSILCQYFHGRTTETPTPEHSEQTIHLPEVQRQLLCSLERWGRTVAAVPTNRYLPPNYQVHSTVVLWVSFLDTTVILDGTILHTDLYTKPTDTHQYFLPSSCHPGHCTNSIPYSQALRLEEYAPEMTTSRRELENWRHIW